MDRFPTSEPHYRKQQRRPFQSSPYHRVKSTTRPSVSFAQSPTPHARNSHSKYNFHGKPQPNASRRRQYSTSMFADEDTFVNNDPDMDEHYQPDSDESLFHWDEEDTLLSELMDEEPKKTEEDELNELVESLQIPFTAQGKRTKKVIAQTLVKTNKQVKEVYRLLDDKVDVHYGKGIYLFKKASTTIESAIYAQQADFKQIHEATQLKIEALFEELREECEARDNLWIRFEKDMNEIVGPVLETLKDTPAQVEHTIAKLEKYSKSLEAGSKTGSSSVNKVFNEFMMPT